MGKPAWRLIAMIAVLLVIALTAITLVPAASSYQQYISAAALALALVTLAAIVAFGRSRIAPPAAITRTAELPAAQDRGRQAEAEVVGFLALLQEKGRFIDFLMDDINPYDDSQVGAAARVVHAGCKAVLEEHFRIQPVRQESEGSRISVPAGYQPDEYRLVGKISGEAPFSGVLVHRGWKAEFVKLPRVMRNLGDRLPTLAPAEVELK